MDANTTRGDPVVRDLDQPPWADQASGEIIERAHQTDTQLDPVPETAWQAYAPKTAPTPEATSHVSPATMPLRQTLLFLGGVGLIILGVFAAGRQGEISWLPPLGKNVFAGFLWNYQWVIGGLFICLIGAILVGLAKPGDRPDKAANQPLGIIRLRRDPVALVLLLSGAVSYGLLLQHLLTNGYAHTDIALFFVGLALVGLGLHRLDYARGNEPGAQKVFGLPDFASAIGLGLLSAEVNIIGLTDWHFAWWGDEGSFFDAAKTLAQAGNHIQWNFFDLTYVYSAHPLVDSLYQGLVMKVFGPSVIGWRMSEVLLVAVSASLMYLLGAALFGQIQGVAASIILGTSHYLMAFTRLAYNNLHIVFCAVLVMLMLALAWRTGKVIFVFATGVAVGLSVYTFSVALFGGVLIALVLTGIFLRKPSKRQVAAGGLMLLGFGLAAAPGFIVTPITELLQLAAQNSYQSLPQTGALPPWAVGLIDSTVVFWTNNQWRHHYVNGPLMDAVSGCLVIVGLGVGIMQIRKREFGLGLTWFVGGLLLIGLTDFAPEAHLTRLMYLVPALALFGGVAAGRVYSLLKAGLCIPTAFSAVLVAALLVAIPPLNAYRLLVERVPGQAQDGNWFPMVIKALDEHRGYPIVQVGKASKVDDNLHIMLEQYPWLEPNYSYESISQVLNTSRAVLSTGKVIYLFEKDDADLRARVVAQLPPNYSMLTDLDRATGRIQWLLVPDPVPESGQAP